MRIFEMDVKDTFFFKDGTTVFVGSVKSEQKFIHGCDCEIVAGDSVKGFVHIDGEMVPSHRKALGEQSAYRSVSTKQSIDLAALGVGRSGFAIRSKADASH